MAWQTDRRRPTWYTRLYERAMWLARDKQAFEGERHTLHQARRRQADIDQPPTRWTRAAARVSVRDVAGMTVWTARPRRARPVARVVYVHGGGYLHPLTADYWRLVRALVRAAAEVAVPAYPLAPDSTVDDVLPRLVEVFEQAAAASPELPVVAMGDSAGGALVLAVAQRLRDLRRPSPAGVVGLSPWLDATLSGQAVAELEASDPMLAESGLRAAGRWWSGRRSPEDPLVSPVRASLAGLPPIDVFIGRHDILRPGVDDFAARAEADGAELRVWEVTAMFHVWMTRLVPEGRRARRQLAALVRERAGRQPPPEQA